MSNITNIAVPGDFIYEFFCEDILVTELENEIKNNKEINWEQIYTARGPTNTQLSYIGTPVPVSNTLLNWFDSCVKSVGSLYFDNKKFSICDIWLTRTNFGQYSGFHYHPYSIFSGLFYIDNHNTETEFFYESNFFEKFKLFGAIKNENKISIKPNKGKLLIFPSYLYHKISISKSKDTRHTLAFNTFFDDIVSSRLTENLKLQVIKPPTIL